MRQRLTVWLGSMAVALIASGCIVNAAPEPTPIVTPNYGYAPAGDGEMVAEPSPYEVSSMPPEPLYEQMSASPGYGYVWIDGYWHWNGDEWVWVSGRWEREQDGYAYVQPYYASNDGGYIYTPGYWRSQRDLPHGWVLGSRGEGRPPIVRPPQGWRPAPTAGHVGAPTAARQPVGQSPQPQRYPNAPSQLGGRDFEPEGGYTGRAPVAVHPPAGTVLEHQPEQRTYDAPTTREPESRYPPQAPHPDPEPYVPSRPTQAPVERGGGGGNAPAERPSAPPAQYREPVQQGGGGGGGHAPAPAHEPAHGQAPVAHGTAQGHK